jgi:Ca2+-transporting ATPase
MTTVHRYPAKQGARSRGFQLACQEGSSSFIAFTKGAVDVLLGISDSVWVNVKREPLNEALRDRLSAENDMLAANGMRVLGVAFRCLVSGLPKTEADDLERELIFVGMVGMIDPPRPEAASAVAKCKKAGIRPMMITGDHPLTACYIATQLGISDNGMVVTGLQIQQTSQGKLEQLTVSTPVYARLSPEHKLRIVEGLHRRGHIVAMTGDGVNDAPALKKAG